MDGNHRPPSVFPDSIFLLKFACLLKCPCNPQISTRGASAVPCTCAQGRANLAEPVVALPSRLSSRL